MVTFIWFHLTYFFSGTWTFQGIKSIPNFHTFFIYFKDTSKRVGLNPQPPAPCTQFTSTEPGRVNRRKFLKTQLLQTRMEKILKQKQIELQRLSPHHWFPITLTLTSPLHQAANLEITSGTKYILPAHKCNPLEPKRFWLCEENLPCQTPERLGMRGEQIKV